MPQETTIAITRSQKDAGEFVRLAGERGARAMALPTIRLVARGGRIADEFLSGVREYDPDYSVFMSSKAVQLLFDSAEGASKTAELRLAIANTAVVAVGPVTRDALMRHGIKTNHMPAKTFSSVGVGEVLSRLGAADKKALIPRSSASTPFLKSLLNKIGVDVRELHVYDVRAVDDASGWGDFVDLFLRSRIDGIVFTSASSVRAFFEIMQRDNEGGVILERLAECRVVSIGPFTSYELEERGVGCVTARVHTVPGALDAVLGKPGSEMGPPRA